jgi:hypothetical protein
MRVGLLFPTQSSSALLAVVSPTLRVGNSFALNLRVTASIALSDAKRESADQVAREILGYFLRNPGAMDNLGGIARWRLLEEAIHRTVESTADALQWLTAEGFLKEVPMEGTGPFFRLNRSKRLEAQNFLESAERRNRRRKS